MDGWNTILSYWVSAYFQGRTVSFREGRTMTPSNEQTYLICTFILGQGYATPKRSCSYMVYFSWTEITDVHHLFWWIFSEVAICFLPQHPIWEEFLAQFLLLKKWWFLWNCHKGLDLAYILSIFGHLDSEWCMSIRQQQWPHINGIGTNHLTQQLKTTCPTQTLQIRKAGWQRRSIRHF